MKHVAKLIWNADAEAVQTWSLGEADELRYKVAKEMGYLPKKQKKIVIAIAVTIHVKNVASPLTVNEGMEFDEKRDSDLQVIAKDMFKNALANAKKKGEIIMFTKADFERNEDNNYHTENGVEIAKHFGTKEEQELMAKIAKIIMTLDILIHEEIEARNGIVNKYFHMLEQAQPTKEDETDNEKNQQFII